MNTYLNLIKRLGFYYWSFIRGIGLFAREMAYFCIK